MSKRYCGSQFGSSYITAHLHSYLKTLFKVEVEQRNLSDVFSQLAYTKTTLSKGVFFTYIGLVKWGVLTAWSL